MKRFVLIVNFLALSAPVPPAFAETSPETLKYNRCISESVRMIDDDKSDAASVARGLMYWCHKEESAMLQAFSKKHPNAGTEMELRRAFRETFIDQATMSVLVHRKTKL